MVDQRIAPNDDAPDFKRRDNFAEVNLDEHMGPYQPYSSQTPFGLDNPQQSFEHYV